MMKKHVWLFGLVVLATVSVVGFRTQNVMAEPTENAGEIMLGTDSNNQEEIQDGSVSESQGDLIARNCREIREKLVEVQHDDARERVRLGRRYEVILTNFITPLNVALVENNLPSEDLIINQSDFVKVKTRFAVDFVEYQKVLEGLIKTNCTAEPGKFEVELEQAKALRAVVANDVKKLDKLLNKQLLLVNDLRSEL